MVRGGGLTGKSFERSVVFTDLDLSTSVSVPTSSRPISSGAMP